MSITTDVHNEISREASSGDDGDVDGWNTRYVKALAKRGLSIVPFDAVPKWQTGGPMMPPTPNAAPEPYVYPSLIVPTWAVGLPLDDPRWNDLRRANLAETIACTGETIALHGNMPSVSEGMADLKAYRRLCKADLAALNGSLLGKVWASILLELQKRRKR